MRVDAKGAQTATAGMMGGFPIRIDTGGRVGRGRAEVVVASPYPISVAMVSLTAEEPDPLGIIRSMENKLRSFEQVRQQAGEQISHLSAEVINADRHLAADWEHADNLAAALRRQAEIDAALHPAAVEITVGTNGHDQQQVSATACHPSGTVAASQIAGHQPAHRPRRAAGIAL